MSLEPRYMLYTKLLMASQKNVLLVGAPGVGKTLLTRKAAKTLVEPVLVTGRGGLTYERLTAYYMKADNEIRLVPGEFFKAVISAWLLLASLDPPRHLIVDEINRCNTDILLGEAFTTMYIMHRISASVLRGEAHHLAVRILEELSKGKTEILRILELAGYDLPQDNLHKAAKELAEILNDADGVPFPYSFRILATMNIYDRANLYRVGWALQRRFATLYVIAPYEKLNPKLDTSWALERLEKRRNSGAATRH